jgi:hypothetical protein
VKQALLDEPRVVRRAELLRDVLGRLLTAVGDGSPRRWSFPPPFSAN